MKKLLSIVLSFTLAVGVFSACTNAPATAKSSSAPQSEAQSQIAIESQSIAQSQSQSEITAPAAQRTKMRVASLKGPTTMGLVKLMSDVENKTAKHDYEITMYGSADEIAPQLIKGDIDIAYVPCNLASVLYNKTKGQIKVAAVNTLGVLYIVEQANDIKTVADLKGRTIYATGKGTTVEFVLNYILKQNNLEPGKDVIVEYKSEATEVVAALTNAQEGAVALLPQPYVTTLQMQNEKFNIALDMTKEWSNVSPDKTLVTGVTVARTEFIEQNEAAFLEFLDDAALSAKYTNENVDSAAELVVKYGIVPKLPIAIKAIPKCNIDFITGDNMANNVKGYLEVLFESDAKSVGGSLPGEDFYYYGPKG